MSIKRIVDTKFWEDEKVLDKYSVEDKYFMLYLLTNPKTTQLGIYLLPKKIISFQSGYTREVVEVLIQRFQDKYKNIVYNHETQEIAVLNSLKYSIVSGGKPVSDLLQREIKKVETTELIYAVYKHMSDWWELSDRPFDKTVMNIFEIELKERKVPKERKDINDNDNDNENEESYHDSYHDSSKESKKPTKKVYGSMNNVKLTDNELERLHKDYPQKLVEDTIENLSLYMASTGKRYKSHNATIRAWIRRDENKSKGTRKSQADKFLDLIGDEE